MKRNKNKKGFTIVELVIVIGVIGILSAILIPTFVNLTDKANKAALKSNLANAYSMYAADAADGTYEVLDDKGEPTGVTYEIEFRSQEDVVLAKTENNETKYYTFEKHGTDTEKSWGQVADDYTFDTNKYKLVVKGGEKSESASTFDKFVVYYDSTKK